jgi:hypothetical protein
MDRFSRIVLGYHGCKRQVAEALIRGKLAIKDWRASRNTYDWLGEGIYFWEYAPERARNWGKARGVVGAVIQLGTCLDFMEVRSTEMLGRAFETVRARHEARRLSLPRNKGKRRDLDCLVINALVASSEKDHGIRFQTVRSPFLEGDPAFPDSGILRESHVQIAVRDPTCILGVFRPNLE